MDHARAWILKFSQKMCLYFSVNMYIWIVWPLVWIVIFYSDPSPAALSSSPHHYLPEVRDLSPASSFISSADHYCPEVYPGISAFARTIQPSPRRNDDRRKSRHPEQRTVLANSSACLSPSPANGKRGERELKRAGDTYPKYPLHFY